ncbi:hypothetical protein, partial [Streptomyces sp. NPDC127112]|uniref:hypothetical protein n=1 Tax=Streptomyces sp. NPDC127112 TaxID=3345364 RepID=UPI00362F5DA6
MKTTPSIPTDAHVSHSRTVYASVVDGHSTHGAANRRSANTDSSASLRCRYGQGGGGVSPLSAHRDAAALSAAHARAR